MTEPAEQGEALQAKCPTCMGSGSVEVLLDTECPQPWIKYKGTKKLWDAYSHAADNYPTGVRFSGYCKIMSFTKEKDKGIYSLNTTRGSWPYVTEKELLTRFKFISRKTGQETKFKGTDLPTDSPEANTKGVKGAITEVPAPPKDATGADT